MFSECKFNYNIKKYSPGSILFSYNNIKVTVTMAINSLNCILEIIQLRGRELSYDYKKAKLVFESIKLILNNKTPKNHTKEEMNLAIDILEKIMKMYARTGEEYNEIHNCALYCKFLISGFNF